MGTRTLAQVAPTAGQIALNAYIYGYGGHSLVTPHAALKQLWWTDERIEAKVTRAFVVSKLRGEERGFLDRPLAFGEGLTDDTYMEWILERAKRLFLILTEIGVPDQIFGCIDDSWDDDDLPIPLENVQSLELAYEEDEELNKKFYDMQFVYLLRELQRGAHIDYGRKEHIPMEYVNTLPPAVSLQAWDRVHFPERPDEIFVRRKFPLNDKEEKGLKHHKAFLKDVRKAQSLRHVHIASAWASYTSENSGYVLSDFVSEHTLRTFIDHRTPMQFVRVPLHERPTILLEWMHCLADALAFMHSHGSAHTAIRPSNILIDRNNRIAFAEVGSLRTFQQGKKASKAEAYDYAAPESQICRESVIVVSSPPVSSKSAFSRIRKMSSGTSSSSSRSSSSTGSSTRSNSFCTTANTTPVTPSFSRRSNSITSLASTISPFRNFSRHLGSPTSPSSPFAPSIHPPPSPTSTITSRVILPKPTVIDPSTLRDLPVATPEMSDIFSLACVYLDLITFLLRGKITDFVKFRSQCSAPTHSYDSQPGNLTSSKTSIYSSSNNSPPQQQQFRPRAHKPRPDASFHALDPSRLDAWLSHLRAESSKRPEEVFRCVPELLRLCKRMMAQNATVRPTALQVRDVVQVVIEADGNGNTRRLCCAGRAWDAEEEEMSDVGISGGVSGSVKRERERVQSCLMGLAQQQDGRASALSQGGGYEFGNEEGEQYEEEEEEAEGGAAEAPDVPRERERMGSSLSGSVSKGWKKAFGRMR
jgi:serine/threonine protein kinase